MNYIYFSCSHKFMSILGGTTQYMVTVFEVLDHNSTHIDMCNGIIITICIVFNLVTQLFGF